MRDLIDIIQKKIEVHLENELCKIYYKDPRNQESFRRKAQIFAKNQKVPNNGPYKATFDYVRLSYTDYQDIIQEWYYRSAA